MQKIAPEPGNSRGRQKGGPNPLGSVFFFVPRSPEAICTVSLMDAAVYRRDGFVPSASARDRLPLRLPVPLPLRSSYPASLRRLPSEHRCVATQRTNLDASPATSNPLAATPREQRKLGSRFFASDSSSRYFVSRSLQDRYFDYWIWKERLEGLLSVRRELEIRFRSWFIRETWRRSCCWYSRESRERC